MPLFGAQFHNIGSEAPYPTWPTRPQQCWLIVLSISLFIDDV